MLTIRIIDNDFFEEQYGKEFILSYYLCGNRTNQISRMHEVVDELHVDFVSVNDYNTDDVDVFFIIQSYNVYSGVFLRDEFWNGLPSKIKTGLQCGNLKLVIDSSFEATDESADAIEFCNKHSIPKDNLYYFTGNLLNDKTDVDKTFPVSCFEYMCNHDIPESDYNPLLYTHRIAKYLCHCGKVKINRLYVLLHLLKSGAMENGYTSCWLDYNLPEDVTIERTDFESCISRMKSHKRFSEYEGYDNELFDMLPLYLDSDSTFPELEFTHLSADLYRTSYYSIVLETYFYNSNTMFMTEKTFKPISQKHPFVLVGVKGALKHLRQMGYKTFHPYINESYDELDNSDRLSAILCEIERLNNLSRKEWDEMYEQIVPVLEHNYKRFRNANEIFKHCGIVEFIRSEIIPDP